MIKAVVVRFLRDEAGVTAIEYGLIATLVGVAIIAGAMALGGQLNQTLEFIASTVGAASS